MRIKLVENECLLSSPNKLVDLLNLENMINNFLNDNLSQLIADYLDNNLASNVDTYLDNNLSTSVDNYLDDNLSQDVELYLNDSLEDKMDTYVTENNIATTSDIDKPVVLYETDGTTGLLGINATTLTNLWQLENMDFTPYKLLKCYFKMSDYSQTSNYLTPSLVIDLPLDLASLPKAANDTNISGPAPVPCDIYLGGDVHVIQTIKIQDITYLLLLIILKLSFRLFARILYMEQQKVTEILMVDIYIKLKE